MKEDYIRFFSKLGFLTEYENNKFKLNGISNEYHFAMNDDERIIKDESFGGTIKNTYFNEDRMSIINLKVFCTTHFLYFERVGNLYRVFNQLGFMINVDADTCRAM